MERGRHRKSRSASGIEGIWQIHNLKAVSRLSSDSRSYIDGSTRKDMFVLDLDQSSVRRATGTSMKHLLAEEMSKAVEPKRRSPNIIAKLMGLEGLSSPQHVDRRQKRSSGSSQQKKIPVDFQSSRQLYDGLSNTRSSFENQEFKDVYEDLEASHLANRRYSSRWSASSMLTKHEMALIQEKFIDAKRLSTDEKLQGSKALDEALGMLESNKNLLLKFLEKPNSLFVNQLHNENASSSRGSHIAVLKPSSSAKYEGNYKRWNSERDTSNKRHITSNVKRKDGLLLKQNDCNTDYVSRKPSMTHLEDKNDENILSTRIVLLKPNILRMQNACISGSSADHLHDPSNFRKMKEYPIFGNAKTTTLRRNNSSHNAGFSKTVAKEDREIARKIARRMRDGCDETVDEMPTCFRGYAGDESSYEANESDSDSELEGSNLSSKKSFDYSNLRKFPACHLAEPSVIREAQHRLLERWKMTQRYQDLEITPKGSTLGEMLSLPDREKMARQLDMNTSHGKAHRLDDNHNGAGNFKGPLGISTKDGWKVETSRTSRSRSLHPSRGGKNHRRSTYHDEFVENKHLICSDNIHRGREPRSKQPIPCRQTLIAGTDSLLETKVEIQMEERAKHLSEKRTIIQMAAKYDANINPESHVKMIDEHVTKNLASESSVVLPKEPSSAADDDISSTHELEDSGIQEPNKALPEQDSPLLCLRGNSSENSKVADRASPDSVLDVPFREDTSSSSESFERVGAELHELRMQLKLLKMESGTYSEVSSLTPREEQIAQFSHIISGENNLSEAECWEMSYTLDVLIDSGLEESGFDIFITKWYAPDCPLDPRLFDDLENKHNGETSGLKSERRLIFDRINLTLLEIFNDYVDLFPWLKPNLAGFSFTEQKDDVQVVLEKLISQDDANVEITERRLDKEMQWLDCRGEIDAVGNEIEKLLINDLIIEVLCN